MASTASATTVYWNFPRATVIHFLKWIGRYHYVRPSKGNAVDKSWMLLFFDTCLYRLKQLQSLKKTHVKCHKSVRTQSKKNSSFVRQLIFGIWLSGKKSQRLLLCLTLHDSTKSIPRRRKFNLPHIISIFTSQLVRVNILFLPLSHALKMMMPLIT